MNMRKNMKIILSILLLVSVMTGCKSKPAEKPAEDNEEEEVIQEETQKPEYDNSQQFTSVVLQDGDSVTGGTYTATGTDESVFEASDNVKAEITGSVINKESGDASSADASSFRGVNTAVRAYGNSTITMTTCFPRE